MHPVLQEPASRMFVHSRRPSKKKTVACVTSSKGTIGCGNPVSRAEVAVGREQDPPCNGVQQVGCSPDKEFQAAGEDIQTSILANRLQLLVETGLVKKRRYQDNPPRYAYFLTEAGLLPVRKAMAAWASRHIDWIRIPNFRRQSR